MGENIILVSGTMRSGTTLMSVMLNAHPDIAIITDKINWFWNRIYPYYKLDSSVSLEQALFEQEHYIKIGLDILKIDFNDFKDNLLKTMSNCSINEIIVYKTIHRLIMPEPPLLIGDKSTQSFPIYEKFINSIEGKIIHMIRDPFDVYYSQVTKVYRNKNKRNNKLKDFVAKIFHRYIHAKDRFLLSSLSHQKRTIYETGSIVTRNYYSKNPISIIDSWVKATQEAIKLMEIYPENLLIVKYEDLILNREDTLISIMKFLGCSYNRQYFEFNKLKNESGNQFVSNSSFNQNNASYDKSRIGNGKQNIGEDDLNYIKTHTKSLLKKFKYE